MGRDAGSLGFTRTELVEKPFRVTEYQQLMYWCKHCKCYHYVKLPENVEKAGLFGPNMIALTAYLKGRCHVSYRTLKEYFRDVVGVDVSTGFLVKQIQKTSAALKSPYEELEEFLKQQHHLYIDETSFKKNGKLQWACVSSRNFSRFSRLTPLVAARFCTIRSATIFSAASAATFFRRI